MQELGPHLGTSGIYRAAQGTRAVSSLLPATEFFSSFLEQPEKHLRFSPALVYWSWRKNIYGIGSTTGIYPHHLKHPYSIPGSFYSYVHNHPPEVTINAFGDDYILRYEQAKGCYLVGLVPVSSDFDGPGSPRPSASAHFQRVGTGFSSHLHGIAPSCKGLPSGYKKTQHIST